MFARIYRPSRTAMQSGKNKAKAWVLEFEGQAPKSREPLMGWISGTDTMASEVRLQFATKEEAIAYAKANKIPHQVTEREDPKPVIKSYGDNFAHRRRLPWTH